MSFTERIHAIASSLIGVFTSRVDLVAAEFEDLYLRLGSLLTRLLAAAFLIALALFFLGATIILAVPEPYRWIPAVGLAGLFGAAAWASVATLRRSLREMPPPFSSTRDVLHRDAAACGLSPAGASVPPPASARLSGIAP